MFIHVVVMFSVGCSSDSPQRKHTMSIRLKKGSWKENNFSPYEIRSWKHNDINLLDAIEFRSYGLIADSARMTILSGLSFGDIEYAQKNNMSLTEMIWLKKKDEIGHYWTRDTPEAKTEFFKKICETIKLLHRQMDKENNITLKMCTKKIVTIRCYSNESYRLVKHLNNYVSIVNQMEYHSTIISNLALRHQTDQLTVEKDRCDIAVKVSAQMNPVEREVMKPSMTTAYYMENNASDVREKVNSLIKRLKIDSEL